MKFKDFEIRNTKEYKQYEIIKWQTSCSYGKPYCYTIAFLDYNPKECSWEFRSVGNQYLENREDGLEEYILKYIELLNISQKYMEKECNE